MVTSSSARSPGFEREGLRRLEDYRKARGLQGFARATRWSPAGCTAAAVTPSVLGCNRRLARLSAGLEERVRVSDRRLVLAGLGRRGAAGMFSGARLSSHKWLSSLGDDLSQSPDRHPGVGTPIVQAPIAPFVMTFSGQASGQIEPVFQDSWRSTRGVLCGPYHPKNLCSWTCPSSPATPNRPG